VLVRRGDARGLARALSDLLADPERRARLSDTGRRVAAGYDWAVVARRVLAVYETVVLPGSGEVTASDDEPADLATVPGDVPTWSALRRWVQR
jgi:phosphatidylinositol alpha-mannosyltransferase